MILCFPSTSRFGSFPSLRSPGSQPARPVLPLLRRSVQRAGSLLQAVQGAGARQDRPGGALPAAAGMNEGIRSNKN